MKIETADQVAALIKDRWVLTIGGFGHCGAPEALICALERRFLDQGNPLCLDMIFASGVGDREIKGINRLAHKGLIATLIGGFWSLAPRIGKMVRDNEIEAYNWPQGVVSHLYRAIAGGLPGVVTTVGMGTFVEPRLGGGRLNEISNRRLIDVVDIDGRDHLLYKAIDINCALLRGTKSDPDGNISMEKEAGFYDVLAQAQAVRNSGGIVIFQVESIVGKGEIEPQAVIVPGIFVDYVVVSESDDHWQTYGEHFNAAYCTHQAGAVCPEGTTESKAKQIISRRALLELLTYIRSCNNAKAPVVNIGIGVPEGIAHEAMRGGLLDNGFVLTVESGAIGGYPAGGNSFGASASPQAILNQAELFDFYNGGGIDIAFLGFGQIDQQGRVDVCGLASKINGVGGYINISQAARYLVFCGTFTTSGLEVVYDDVKGLEIIQEGGVQRFVAAVTRVCYDPSGHARCRTPLLITERAVFKIHPHFLEMIELAHGCIFLKDVKPYINIPVGVSHDLKVMPRVVFCSEPIKQLPAPGVFETDRGNRG